MGQLGGFNNVAFHHQLKPVRNVVVYRALPLTVGVAAVQAAVRLARRIGGLERLVNFRELFGSGVRRFFLWVFTTHVDKLKIVI